jgi:FkbM family methyltransferase
MTQLQIGALSIHVPARASAEVAFLYHEIFEQHCYLRHGIQVRAGDVVIDAGANLGLFSMYLATRVPGARIHAFEPLPPIFECAKQNLNGLDGVQLHALGLSNRAGEVAFEYFPKAPSNSTMYPGDKRGETRALGSDFKLSDIYKVSKLHGLMLTALYPLRRLIVRAYLADKFRDPEVYPCQLTTLDHFIEHHGLTSIALLKVDVEGAELDVLDGLSDGNLRKVSQLALELSPKHKPQLARLTARLGAAGFTNIVAESAIPGSDPHTDIYPCVVYATKELS